MTLYTIAYWTAIVFFVSAIVGIVLGNVMWWGGK